MIPGARLTANRARLLHPALQLIRHALPPRIAAGARNQDVGVSPNPVGSCGLPHSSYSPVVNGIVESDMVVMTSTYGTPAMTPRNSSGRRLTTAPMRSPPALAPRANRRFEDV